MQKNRKVVDLFLDGLALWLTLVCLFQVGRLLFLVMRLDRLAAGPYVGLDLATAFISGLRFDSAASAYLSVIFLALSLLASVLRKPAAIFLVALAWTLVTTDHFFYDYYNDHFNSFFWEFWSNASNAALVIASIGSEFPVAKIAFILLAGYLTFGFLVLKALRRVQKWQLPWLRSRPILCTVLGLLLFAFLSRSTFDTRPLTVQDARVDISTHPFINLLHRNPVFPLLGSFKDRQALQNLDSYLAQETLPAYEIFQKVAEFTPGARVSATPDNSLYRLQTVVSPRLGDILLRKPKHVVLLFLESYSAWPLYENDSAFRKEMSEGLSSLFAESIYFKNHFPAGSGTLNNIIGANYGIPLPSDMHPSLSYRPESFKNFGSLLTHAMKGQGYATQFFYGGFSHWHRLYEFAPRMGYDAFFSEGSFPEARHHDWGMHDGDLYGEINKVLKNSPQPTFSFVMTLSNHPPYRVPEEFLSDEIPVPERVANIVALDQKEFRQRLRCFKYADRALAQFIADARKEEYFKDTLFVITGDHPFFGMKEELPNYFVMSKIPLLFFAPELMKPEWKGRTLEKMSSHLDLTPTLMAMVSDKEKTLDSWGMDLFSAQKRDTLLTYPIDCLGNECVVERKLAALDVGAETLHEVDGPEADLRREKLANARKWLIYSGLSYLSRF